MEELSKKEAKLIESLDMNARDSLLMLGKKTGISKQAVQYNLESMENRGIIKGYYPVIDSFRLGYFYCRVFLIFQNVSEKEYKEIITFLKNDPEYFWVITAQGVYDIGIAMWCNNINDFRQRIEKIQSKFGNLIKTKNESVTTQVLHFPMRFLTKQKNDLVADLKESEKTVMLDLLDKEILNVLSINARISIVDVAKKCKCPGNVVAYRIKKMEREEIIKAYRPILDYFKLGFTYYKLWIDINNQQLGKLDSIIEYISHNPIVLYIVKGIGFPYDLDVEIVIKDNQELLKFIFDLRAAFPRSIGDYKSFMFLDTVKVRYLPE